MWSFFFKLVKLVHNIQKRGIFGDKIDIIDFFETKFTKTLTFRQSQVRAKR